MLHKDQLKQMRMVGLAKKKHRRGMTAIFKYLKGSLVEEGLALCLAPEGRSPSEEWKQGLLSERTP